MIILIRSGGKQSKSKRLPYSFVTWTGLFEAGSGAKIVSFFGTISSLKIGVLLDKYFRKQTNS